MKVITDECLRDVLQSALWMSFLDFNPQTNDISTIPDRGSISYISGLFGKFVKSEDLFTPNGFDTLTERFAALGHAGKPFYNADVGNFALFMRGWFFENIKNRGLRSFYEDVGATSYEYVYIRTAFPTFRELSERFQTYSDIITNARDRYIRLGGDDGITIVPEYEPSRYRGVQQPDGSMRDVFCLPTSFTSES